MAWTVCPSGLRGWTQVPLAQAAWVQIPQLSFFTFRGVAQFPTTHPHCTTQHYTAFPALAVATLQRGAAAATATEQPSQTASSPHATRRDQITRAGRTPHSDKPLCQPASSSSVVAPLRGQWPLAWAPGVCTISTRVACPAWWGLGPLIPVLEGHHGTYRNVYGTYRNLEERPV